LPNSFRPTIKPLPAFFGICAAIFFPIFFVVVVITLIMPESCAGATTILISRSPAEVSLSLTNGAYDHIGLLNELMVLQSGVVLERVAKNLDLPMVWGKKYNNGQPMNLTDVLAMLKSRLDISIVRPRDGSPVDLTDNVPFRICAYSDNPEEAARIANAVVDGYRAFWQEESHQASAVPKERRVTVLDPAVPAYRPVRPNKPLNLALGAFAGVLVGAIIAPLVLGLVAWGGNRRSSPRRTAEGVN
jgi:uncharacterized protein involved in exopolysaccharide biosynthesis